MRGGPGPRRADPRRAPPPAVPPHEGRGDRPAPLSCRHPLPSSPRPRPSRPYSPTRGHVTSATSLPGRGRRSGGLPPARPRPRPRRASRARMGGRRPRSFCGVVSAEPVCGREGLGMDRARPGRHLRGGGPETRSRRGRAWPSHAGAVPPVSVLRLGTRLSPPSCCLPVVVVLRGSRPRLPPRPRSVTYLTFADSSSTHSCCGRRAPREGVCVGQGTG